MMSKVGAIERVTQNRIVKLFKDQLGYDNLGDWKARENKNIERALRELDQAEALGDGGSLYDANKDVYHLLHYGIKVKEGAGEQNQTVWLINWAEPEKNDFAIAEEVTVKGNNTKRQDVVLYLNGIAIAVIELKRSTIGLTEGILQNLLNQRKDFIRTFFTTMQLIMVGNDTQGLRYGTIETSEKYYLEWKEDGGISDYKLDRHLSIMCEKHSLLELIHNFIVFDAGVKKTCRQNQYFGIKEAQDYIRRRQGGIIWHTQGSGKSLTMVWLTKWIRENVKDSHVLIITDRTELDEQIEKVYRGVDEDCLPHFDLIIQSWDTAMTANEFSDYSVGMTIGFIKDGDKKYYYILDVVRKKMEYPELVRYIQSWAHKNEYTKRKKVIVEDAGSGKAVIQSLRAEGHSVCAYKPTADKHTRLIAVTDILESGFVYLPEKSRWLDDFLLEVTRFPNAKHDDQVDALSQELNWLTSNYRVPVKVIRKPRQLG